MLHLLAVNAAPAFVAQPALLRAASPAAFVAPVMAWQDEPIFDKEKPDPVFDRESQYKGRVSYGFSNQAELLNGRAAMMGFTVAYFQELFVGKGILEQYGFGYDEGAVFDGNGSGLPSVVGILFAFIFTAGLSYGGEYLNNKVINKDYQGNSLPFSPFAPDKK